MALTIEQVKPGVVAYLNHEALNSHSYLKKPPSPAPRSGPFLCYALESDGTAYWSEITTGNGRFEIVDAWKRGGSEKWRKDKQFLNGAQTSYVGPAFSFIIAASGTDTFGPLDRPLVSPEGIRDVLSFISDGGGPVPG